MGTSHPENRHVPATAFRQDDRDGVRAGLAASSDPRDRELAARMTAD